MTDEVRRLIEWIANNTEAEPMSGWMPGGPYWNTNTRALLDQIGTEFGIEREDVGTVFNSTRERIEEQRKR